MARFCVWIPVFIFLIIFLTKVNYSLARAIDTETNGLNDESVHLETTTRKKNAIMEYIGKKKDKLVDKITNKTKSSVDLVQNTVTDIYQTVLKKKLNYTEKLVNYVFSISEVCLDLIKASNMDLF